MLELMNVDVVMPRFCSILMEMSSPRELTHYKTGFWGRAQVILFFTDDIILLHVQWTILMFYKRNFRDINSKLHPVKNFLSFSL